MTESASAVSESGGATRPDLAVSISSVHKAFADTDVLRGIDLQVGSGEIVALLGPSGCGKSTLLRILSGLETLDSGRVVIDGVVVATSGDRGSVHVAPERRNVGLVFQNGALFPHLTVAENLAYGLGRRGDREARSARVDELLGLVDLDGLADRYPDQLSGGQQQRVALARALAPSPSVLLLDEPFSNLDARLRQSLRREVAEVLREANTPAILVTHDRDEAFAVADRVAVMREGSIAQVGSPVDVYERPVDAWVATFVGDANLLTVTKSGITSAETVLGTVRIDQPVDAGELVLVRPEHVVFERSSTWPLGVVVGVEFTGATALVEVDADGVRLRSEQPWHRAALRVGDEVVATLTPGLPAHRLNP